ncbi:hypothetical protein BZA05DRAFT_331033 [Tricharina praecox]|uniref:uncharacterized protein n=1 Tax=Tricharina praecox TaxID=43433 RepID=UPI00221F5422|nr:uncharacterized protein BZA05DRAFT_331033 [Tricharina praecox]KAI5858060.1 hypothetical protein BZA05DRAFT_331033 [Tricharina praecox]
MSASPPTSLPHITLHGFPKSANAPSLSGYCHKLETFLRASGFTNYVHASSSTTSSAPKKKLPYITLTTASGVSTHSDSHFIVQHLLATGIVRDIDAEDAVLAPHQRADSRAYIAWTEELVYLAVVHTRWARDHNFAVVAAGLPMPAMLRGVLAWWLRWNITSALWTAGIGRHSDGEIEVLMKEYVDAVEAKLAWAEEQGAHWLLATRKPALVDVVVWAFLANALAENAGNREYAAMVLARNPLRRYVERGCRLWFPEYEDLLAAVEGGAEDGGALGEEGTGA